MAGKKPKDRRDAEIEKLKNKVGLLIADNAALKNIVLNRELIASNTTLADSIAVCLYVLRNQHGFANKRMLRLLSGLDVLGTDLQDGRLDIVDIRQALIDECNVDVYKLCVGD